MHTDKITIITVCLNSSETIRETIESVLSQGRAGIEYIIIDGGSTDGTQDIIKSYGKSIDVFISEPDEGISDAFNKGILRARNEIIGLINSDDALLPGALDKVRAYFAKNPKTEVIHGDVLLYDDGRFVKKIGPSGRWWYPWRLILFNHPATFVKSSVYRKFGMFDTRYKIAMDVALFLQWKRSEVHICYLPEPLVKMATGGMSSVTLFDGYIETRRAFLENGYPAIPVNLLFVLKLILHGVASVQLRCLRLLKYFCPCQQR